MLKTLSDSDLNELEAHWRVANDHLKSMERILFVCTSEKSKKGARVTKKDRHNAIALELSKSLGANFLNYSIID